MIPKPTALLFGTRFSGGLWEAASEPSRILIRSIHRGELWTLARAFTLSPYTGTEYSSLAHSLTFSMGRPAFPPTTLLWPLGTRPTRGGLGPTLTADLTALHQRSSGSQSA